MQESVLQRCFVAEKLTAIAASPSGAFVAAGATSGNLYIWNTATGRLLLGFKAHYKVRCEFILLHVLVLSCPDLLCYALSLQVPQLMLFSGTSASRLVAPRAHAVRSTFK